MASKNSRHWRRRSQKRADSYYNRVPVEVMKSLGYKSLGGELEHRLEHTVSTTCGESQTECEIRESHKDDIFRGTQAAVQCSLPYAAWLGGNGRYTVLDRKHDTLLRSPVVYKSWRCHDVSAAPQHNSGARLKHPFRHGTTSSPKLK